MNIDNSRGCPHLIHFKYIIRIKSVRFLRNHYKDANTVKEIKKPLIFSLQRLHNRAAIPQIREQFLP